MTKEYWLYVRNLMELPYEVWYSFYKEKGGYLNDINEFVRIFSQLLMSPVMYNNRIYPQIRFDKATHKIHNHFNKKYGVT